MSQGADLLLQRALSGERPAIRGLVDGLAPVVQARVVRTLSRFRTSGQRSVRQEVEDMTQEVFLALFADRAKVLRAWQPERGLSLRNFVGLVTERQVTSILRTKKRNPWADDPTLPEDMNLERNDAPDAELRIANRDELRAVLDRLREQLSPQGLHLFYALLVEQRPIGEICAETGMSRDALYAWRSRLRKLVRKLAIELNDDAGGDGHAPPHEARSA